MLSGILRRLELQCFSSRRFSGSVFRSPINQRSQLGVRLHSSHSKGDVIFSGIQPTGVPHLGNYLGALQQWTRMQNDAAPSTKLLYSIVDLHAITIQQDADQLRRWKRETLATLLASGLDPDRCAIFYQSTV
jgi:tryptophanyl-tRNA synthetase